MSGFKREIKLFDAIMMVSGTMIGSGIFIVSADMTRTLGGGGWMILAWLITGFITMVGALSYGELAGMMPKAGGQYVYLREAFHPLVAFLYGWTLLLVIQTGTIAAVAVAFAKFTAYFIPFFSEKNVLIEAGYLKITHAQLLAIPLILFLTWMNTRGVRNGKLIQNIFGSTKIVAIILLVIVAIGFGAGSGQFTQNWQNAWQSFTTSVATDPGTGIKSLTVTPVTGFVGIIVAMGIAMVGSLFSSDAWNNISFAGDEIQNPKRTLPIALGVGVALVTLLYIVTNFAYLMVLPLHGDPNADAHIAKGIAHAAEDRVAVSAASAVAGDWAALLIAGLIMVSTFSCLNGCILAGSRVYYSMSRDGLFFPSMGKLNGKGVPAVALAVQAVWSSLLCLSGNYGRLLDYVMFAVILFYIVTIVGLFVLRVKRPNAERPYKALGYPVLPALYILLAGTFCVILLVFKPENAWPGLIIVALGAVVYLIFRKRYQKMSGPEDGNPS